MCGGAPDVDTSVQDQMLADSKRAREEEEQRKARITAGTADIQSKFGQFDDSFFDGYQKTYMDFYQPDVDNKFGDAKDQLTYALARAGTLNSSVAGEKLADLQDDYTLQNAMILSQAQDATGNLRGNVNQEKSSLISLLNATGDSELAGNEALARSSQLFKAQPSYNPLGDIFGGAAQGIGAYYTGRNDRRAYDAYFNPGAAARSGGSSRIVN